MKTDTRLFLFALAFALAQATALAVDGQVLINQSTVMAAGGFPYIISQPGSYKLSGNLTMNTTQNGNYNGLDIAILINANNVTLDLNGFSLTLVNNTVNLQHRLIGIASSNLNSISIQNGALTFTGTEPALSLFLTGIDLIASGANRLDNISVFQGGSTSDFDSSIRLGRNSIVQRVITNSNLLAACPSIVTESIALKISDPTNAAGCVFTQNTVYAGQ